MASWDDVQVFIGKLNGLEGGWQYRLLTGAEWGYATRLGTSGDRYSGNLDAIAWHDENSGRRTHPVGQKAPNAFGLHDMFGNVWDSVQDWHCDYEGGAVTDPREPAAGSNRVYRGGSWLFFAWHCQKSSFRLRSLHGNRHDTLGCCLLRAAQ